MSTATEWHVRGNYGQGFEVVYIATSKDEADSILNDYRQNEPGVPFTVRRVTIRMAVAW